MRKKFMIGFMIALGHFICAVFSGALGWDYQMLVVSMAGVIAVVITWQKIGSRWYQPLLIVAPFYLIYVPISLYIHAYQTYPIWMFGLFICCVTWVFLTIRISRWIGIPILVFLLLFGWLIIWPNVFAYLGMRKDPNHFDLKQASLLDERGKEIPFESFRGKIVLFDVWHSACISCIRQFPEIQDLYEFYRADTNIRIISLNFPIPRDKGVRPARFTAAYSFPKMYFPDKKEYDRFFKTEMPLVLIIDRNLNCRYAGMLNLEWNIIIGNAKVIINRLKKER